MSTILVVAEHLDGKLKGATLNAVAFANAVAAQEGGDVIGLVLGSGVDSVAAELAQHVAKVVQVDDAQYANYLAESYAPAVSAIASEVGADIVAAAATTTGKDFLPRVAAKLDAGMISDVIAVFEHDGDLAFKRPIWSGNLIAHVTCDADVTCVTVRTTAFDATEGGVSGAVEKKGAPAGAPDNAQFVAFNQVKSDRPELTEADVVVAGGRGLKSADGFQMMEELADKLGGAVGASRAAVDSGYAPNDWQVGQTGKIVAPNLYIAAAISGAIQHLAGMKDSKVIVAINKDPDAPIFEVADIGLVGDLFKIVPELQQAL